ncbi:MAG: carbohydrate ABC transporter permease, partial [Anaerolineae bacterium]
AGCIMKPNWSNPMARTGSRQRKKRARHMGLHLLLIMGSVAMLLPFAWMLSTSLKEPGDVFIYPPQWIPQPVRWENYKETVTVMPFGRFYLNSAIQAISVTALQLVTASLAAFAFARLRFRGRDLLFMLYLATMMIPFPVTMIPNFVIMRYLNWIDTFRALILPPAFSAFSTFLLRQYFMSIPMEMDDAARVDGASSFRIWWQIILPLSDPALATLAIFTFLGQWNSFLWPLIVTNSEKMRTLPVGLATFQSQYSVQWHLLMAGSVIAVLPILFIYIVGQKWFVRGITLTGMGGR